MLGDAEEGFGYVGVWALDPQGCGIIDELSASGFAVITRSTFRDGGKAYFGSFGPMVDGKLSITVRAAQGSRTIEIEQTGPDALTVDGRNLIRCTQ